MQPSARTGFFQGGVVMLSRDQPEKSTESPSGNVRQHSGGFSTYDAVIRMCQSKCSMCNYSSGPLVHYCLCGG